MAAALAQHKPVAVPEVMWSSMHAPRTPDAQDAVGAIAEGGGSGSGGGAGTTPATAACALCRQFHLASQLHFGIMGSFAYCTGCLLKVGAAYANGSSLAQDALASFAVPEIRNQSSGATMRTCGTCVASKPVSDFLRQDEGNVRLDRDCNSCVVAAKSQLSAWHAAAAASVPGSLPPAAAAAAAAANTASMPHGMPNTAFQQHSSAALIAQLSSVLNCRMPSQLPQLRLQPPQPFPQTPMLQQHLPQQPLQEQEQHAHVFQPTPRSFALPPHSLAAPSIPLSRSRTASQEDEDYLPPSSGSGGSEPRRGANGGSSASRSNTPKSAIARATSLKAAGVSKTRKVCSRCKQDKPASCYNLDRGKPDGLYCHCRQCCAEMNAARNQKKVLVMEPTVDAKTCTRCRVHKRAADFYRQNTSADGLRSWCKGCYSSSSAAKAKNRGARS